MAYNATVCKVACITFGKFLLVLCDSTKSKLTSDRWLLITMQRHGLACVSYATARDCPNLSQLALESCLSCATLGYLDLASWQDGKLPS